MYVPCREKHCLFKLWKSRGRGYKLWRYWDANLMITPRALKRQKFQSALGYIMEKISVQNWTRILNLHHKKRILTPSALRPFLKLDFEIFVVFYCTKTHVWIEITQKFWGPAQHSFQIWYNTKLSIRCCQPVPPLTSNYAEGASWKREFRQNSP